MTDPSLPWKKVIVVGGSTGIGAAVTRRLAANGSRIAVVARRSDALHALAGELNGIVGEGTVLPYEHDVRDWEEASALFQDIASQLGGIDLVVYAAAFQPDVRPDEYDTGQDVAIIQTNLVGCIAWLNPAAARFGALKEGTIVAVSSIAGDRGRRGAPVYGASKGGLTVYMESLRNRLSQHGVVVTTVKPGFVDTRLTRGKEGLFWVVSPERAAELILRAARRRRSTAYVPARWRLVATIVRSIPSILFRRLSF